MYFSDQIIEEVRSRNDIVEVISEHIHLTRKGTGQNYWGCCPFHNEKTPSFSVNSAKQMYHCFGCGTSGNVFTFISKYENMTFPEAVTSLAARAGVALPEVHETKEQKERASRKQKLLDVNKEAAVFFYRNLRTAQGEKGMQYLKKRQLSDETIHSFGLGYAGVDGRKLVEHLRSAGYSDDIIRDSGLASFSEKYGLTSQFWNRVMFPILDMGNHVIGFGGRVMGDGEPKYLNSPETPIFDKRRNLYGMNIARKSRAGNIIVCEGYMDVIALHQAGFTQAVASLGTAFTEEQAGLIKRVTGKVYLAYDSDGAGTKAALRNIGILKSVGLSPRVINMRPHKDPDEFIKNLGAEAFRQRIEEAENFFYFEVRVLSEQYNMNDPEQRTTFHRGIAEKLCQFEERAERENYLVAIADQYGIATQNLRELVENTAGKLVGVAKAERPVQARKSQDEIAKENSQRAQGMLLTWLTDDPTLFPVIRKYVKPEDFTDPLYFRVAAKVYSDFEQDTYNPAAIISMFEDDLEQQEVAGMLQRALPDMGSEQDREKALSEIIYAVRRNSYEAFCAGSDGSMAHMQEMLNRKKDLEQLKRTHISIR